METVTSPPPFVGGFPAKHPFWATGWEHGISPMAGTTSAGIGGLCQIVNGTAPTVVEAPGGRGGYAMRIGPAAAISNVEYVEPATNPREIAYRYYLWIETLPSATIALSTNLIEITTEHVGLFLTSAGVLQAGLWDESTYTVVDGPTLTPGQWIMLELRMQKVAIGVAANPVSIIDWWVDESQQPQVQVVAGVTIRNYDATVLGPLTADSPVIYYDDFIASYNWSDGPFGPGRNVACFPSQTLPADHQGITLAQWDYTDDFAAFTPFPSLTETESRSRLASMLNTDGIRMNVAGAPPGYARWPADCSAVLAKPNGVQTAWYWRQASAGSANAQILYALGTSRLAISSFNPSTGGTTLSVAGNADNPATVGAAVLQRPGGGEWQLADMSNLFFELQSSDAAPAFWLAGMCFEIDYPTYGAPVIAQRRVGRMKR